mmetsp:Transcript_3750/g.10645  ORF Transcript_3750/g.10645 Transcript_3750/m.10645 type:complete len:225 (-) Transcript_3750:2444-3118(-)
MPSQGTNEYWSRLPNHGPAASIGCATPHGRNPQASRLFHQGNEDRIGTLPYHYAGRSSRRSSGIHQGRFRTVLAAPDGQHLHPHLATGATGRQGGTPKAPRELFSPESSGRCRPTGPAVGDLGRVCRRQGRSGRGLGRDDSPRGGIRAEPRSGRCLRDKGTRRGIPPPHRLLPHDTQRRGPRNEVSTGCVQETVGSQSGESTRKARRRRQDGRRKSAGTGRRIR